MGEGGRYEILNRVQDMRIHIIKVPPHPAPLPQIGEREIKGKGKSTLTLLYERRGLKGLKEKE